MEYSTHLFIIIVVICLFSITVSVLYVAKYLGKIHYDLILIADLKAIDVDRGDPNIKFEDIDSYDDD